MGFFDDAEFGDRLALKEVLDHGIGEKISEDGERIPCSGPSVGTDS